MLIQLVEVDAKDLEPLQVRLEIDGQSWLVSQLWSQLLPLRDCVLHLTDPIDVAMNLGLPVVLPLEQLHISVVSEWVSLQGRDLQQLRVFPGEGGQVDDAVHVVEGDSELNQVAWSHLDLVLATRRHLIRDMQPSYTLSTSLHNVETMLS